MSTLTRFLPPFVNRLLYHLLPGTCVLCRELTGREFDLCQPCQADLPWLNPNCCSRCAIPLSTQFPLCGRCIVSPPSFHHTCSALEYAYPVDFLLNAYKHHGQLSSGYVLGVLLAKTAAEHYQHIRTPDLLTPVPLHKKRLRLRGFNQSLEVAQLVSDQTQIPLDPNVFLRTRNTPPQQQMNHQQRSQNLKDAFVMQKDLSGQRIAIVDDVLTTGATAETLANLALNSGALSVDIITVARAVK